MITGLLATQIVTQVGILVKDIEVAKRDWAAFLGVPVPDHIITDVEEVAQTKYLGQPSKARAKLAFFQAGPQLSIELIEPDEHPSTWRQDLDKQGEGFHHIAFVVNGIKHCIQKLEAGGMPLLQTGEYTGGRYAYVDARDKLKLVLELLEND